MIILLKKIALAKKVTNNSYIHVPVHVSYFWYKAIDLNYDAIIWILTEKGDTIMYIIS